MCGYHDSGIVRGCVTSKLDRGTTYGGGVLAKK